MDIDLKALFKKEPSLLEEPIDCDLIIKRIEEVVRIKNKEYLDSLDVKMDGKNVLIDIKNPDNEFVKKDTTNRCIFCGCISRYWKYLDCPKVMSTYCSDCTESFQKFQLTKES